MFDVAGKEIRLAALEAQAARPGFWDDQDKAQNLHRERARLELVIKTLETIGRSIDDAHVLVELGTEAADESVEPEARAQLDAAKRGLADMELKRMMAGPHDTTDAIIEIHSGAGGTDAQDWAQMLLRMYTRWIEQHDMKLELLEVQPGEEAGISRATLIAHGPYAFGWLRAESGVHRLVRISPFDSNARRHTAFAAVFIFPQIEDDVDFDIDWEKDVREDRYHSSGAGGQHVNKTESAIRLTHLETGLVVACQSERSQHKNRSMARKILIARIMDLREQQALQAREKLAGTKLKIEWGSQIRSYVMQPYRLVKDHRTGYEMSNVDAVLDGELDGFMEAFLLKGAGGGPGAPVDDLD